MEQQNLHAVCTVIFACELQLRFRSVGTVDEDICKLKKHHQNVSAAQHGREGQWTVVVVVKAIDANAL